MAKQQPYKIFQNGKQVASFVDEFQACSIAQFMSRSYPNNAEVTNQLGIIGQYENGRCTPEFRFHHEARLRQACA